MNNKAVTAYTAIIESGAIAATVLYFFKDIVRGLAPGSGVCAALSSAATTATSLPGL